MATYRIKEMKEYEDDDFPYYELTVKNLDPQDDLDAAKTSLLKWGRIADFLHAHKDQFSPSSKLYIDNGAADTCGFCALYFDNNCVGCPIAELTGRIACRNTPYYEFEHAKTFRQYEKAVAKEIEFLSAVQMYLEGRNRAVGISEKYTE